MNRSKRQRRKAPMHPIPDFGEWAEEHRPDTRGLDALIAQLEGADETERKRLLEESIALELVEQGLETYTSSEGVTVKLVEAPTARIRPGRDMPAEEWLRQQGYRGPANKEKRHKAVKRFLQARMETGAMVPGELFDCELRWFARVE